MTAPVDTSEKFTAYARLQDPAFAGGDYYEADAGVSTHYEHLETTF
ncbi:hypothetical protein IAE22_32255 [Bacillus sp. S34]|nr:hypothetical protein [Bacillus sp. S34]